MACEIFSDYILLIKSTVDPGFYTKNTMMIGKTYARLGKTTEAIEFLSKLKDVSCVTMDDKMVNIRYFRP